MYEYSRGKMLGNLEVKDRSTISCDQKARTEVRPGV